MKARFTIQGIFIAAFLILMPGGLLAQNTQQYYIDINATVERKVTPDELYLSIEISEKEYKGKKSLEELQEAMIGALKENRIDIPNCLTLNYMGSEVSYKVFSTKMKPKTEATYTLKLHDAATMQQVIASLEKRGISNVELEKTVYTKKNELKSEMGIEAMKQAQQEARVLAGAIGQEIGKAMSINSSMHGGQPEVRMYKRNVKIASIDEAIEEDSATAINIGQITYILNVNVRFELK